MIQMQTAIASPCESLYFLHIPKTAGTSLRHWLHDLFAFDDWLACHVLDEVQRLPRDAINQKSFFSGHFGWRFLEYLDSAPPVITWLRDPVQRELSNLHYIRSQHEELVGIARANGRDDWVDYFDLVKRGTLRDILNTGSYVGYNDNAQVRHISGLFPHAEAVILGPSDLERAQHHLQSMLSFGLCEWMNPSLDYLCFRLGVPHLPMVHRMNQGRGSTPGRSGEYSAEDIERLRELNALDGALLDFARQLFRERFTELAEESGVRWEGPEEVNGLAQYDGTREAAAIHAALNRHFQESRRDEPRHSQILVRFADAVLTKGWHPRYTSESGDVLRWAGPGHRASVWVPLVPGQSYRVAMTARSIVSGDLLRTMRMHLGTETQEISWQKLEKLPNGMQPYHIEAVFSESAVSADCPYSQLTVETTGVLRSFKHDATKLVSFVTDGFCITPT